MSNIPNFVVAPGFEVVETCAYLGCPEGTPAEIPVHVFSPGGSYPLWVCSVEHFDGLRAAAPEGVDVIRSRR